MIGRVGRPTRILGRAAGSIAAASQVRRHILAAHGFLAPAASFAMEKKMSRADTVDG